MTTYKIEEVVGQRPWGEGSEYGPKIDYTLALEGVPQQVSLNQKPESPAPKAGDSIDLILEGFPEKQIEKVPRLANMKKATRPKAAFGGGGGGGGPRTDDPKTSRSIAMQASQKVALQMTMFAVEHNLDEETITRMTALFSRFSKAMYRSVLDAQEDKV